MRRAVDASTVVDLRLDRAHDLVLSDPAGIVAASELWGAVELEVGPPDARDGGLRIPLVIRVLDGGPMRALDGELAVAAAGPSVRIELHGTYRWDGPGSGYGGGVLAHRVARWMARDLVEGVGARLLARSVAPC